MDIENMTGLNEIKIENRELTTLKGVIKLMSFSDAEFLVETNLGFLHLTGHNLTLGRMELEKGLLEIKGIIDSLKFLGKNKEEKKESFLQKIFK